MREQLKNKEYFNEFIAEDSARILKLTEKLNLGEIKEARVMPVKQGILRIKMGIIIARYSRGDEIKQLQNDFRMIYKEWLTFFFSPTAYNENLRMTSLAVLFDIEQELLLLTKKKLSENHVNDWFLDFLLNEKSNEQQLLFPKRFHTIKEMYEKTNRIELLKRYIKEEWYNEDNEAFEAHKSKQNIFYGYWSFEAGAIAKILNIDDSSLKDTPYYPYDLVHYAN